MSATPDGAPAGWKSSSAHVSGRNLFWRVLGELSTVRTAATLIAILGITTWVATYYERDYGMAAAHVHVYRAWWFNLVFILIAVAVVGAVLVRIPLQRRQLGFVIVHAGLLLLIIGFWLGANRLDGQLVALPGQPARLIELPVDELSIIAPGDPRSWRAQFQPLEWAGYPSALRYVLKPLWPIPDPGIHTLPEPLQVAQLADGTRVRITRVVDTGASVSTWAPSADPADPLATQVTLAIRPPGASAYQAQEPVWLAAADNRRFSLSSLFTASWAIADNADQVRDFLADGPETAADGRLLVYHDGRRFALVIDPAALPQRLDLGGGLSLTVLRVPPIASYPVLQAVLHRDASPVAPDRTLYISAYDLTPLEEVLVDGEKDLRPAEGMLPGMLYRHPQVAKPAPGEKGAFVQLLTGPDGLLHLRSFTRSKGAGLALTVPPEGWQGSVAGSGQGNGAGMDVRATVSHLPHATRSPQPVRMQPAMKDRAARWLEVEVVHGDKTARKWLRRADRDQVEQIDVPGYGAVMIRYQRALYDLQERNRFAVILDRFEAGTDPGGMGNASYSSEVTVVGADGSRTARRITMNEPLHVDGVTLYQTSFFPEQDDHGRPTGRQGSVFTAASDPGRILKYLGSLVLVAGTLVLYLRRR